MYFPTQGLKEKYIHLAHCYNQVIKSIQEVSKSVNRPHYDTTVSEERMVAQEVASVFHRKVEDNKLKCPTSVYEKEIDLAPVHNGEGVARKMPVRCMKLAEDLFDATKAISWVNSSKKRLPELNQIIVAQSLREFEDLKCTHFHVSEKEIVKKD